MILVIPMEVRHDNTGNRHPLHCRGKPTLPLINALDRGTPEQQNTLREAIENGGLDYID